MLDWRNILCSSRNDPHNPQKLPADNNSADCADAIGSLQNQNTKKLAVVEKYGNFTLQELQEFIGKDWHFYKDSPHALHLLAEHMQSFTAKAMCSKCNRLVAVTPSIIAINKGKISECPHCMDD